jgi:hypothetical protein
MGSDPICWQKVPDLRRLDQGIHTVQIPRVFRVFAILVRTSYLLTALLVLAGAVLWLTEMLQSLVRQISIRLDIWDLYAAAIFAVMCALPLRAITRLLRRAELIPDSHLRERPVVATFVAVTCIFGLLLCLLAASVWLDVLRGADSDDIGGPLGLALMLALMSFSIALLTGELVLVGRLRPYRT